jgi:lipoprotein-anchoring transpeptidase ErfK/SrfK
MHFGTPGLRFLLLPLGCTLVSLFPGWSEEPVLALATLPVPVVTTMGPIVPGTDTILSQIEDLRRAEEARQHALAMEFFSAIARDDKATFCRLLNEGLDPNTTLPAPVPREFVRQFSDELTAYYVGSEQGVTALMLATLTRNEVFVRILLQAGADPWRMTKRHKTFALWLAGKTQQVTIMQMLMGIAPDSEAARTRISVDLSAQRASVWRGDDVVLVTDISSGRPSRPTPTGRFVVTDKYRTWKSTLYHAKMPYFLRLSCGDFGLHAGYLPGYPASHGCIRLPEEVARKLFADIPVGTLVEIR